MQQVSQTQPGHPSQVQKLDQHSQTATVVHNLTPFNGMHAGFNPDGTQNTYSAQVATMKRIGEFTSANGASMPPYRFGYFQLFYVQHDDDKLIQIGFSLPPSQAFTVTLTVTTYVAGSTFAFTLDAFTQTVPAKEGINVPVCAPFSGNASGQYALVINPLYHKDATVFLLTEIRIETH